MRALLRNPITHFLVIGGLLYGVQAGLQATALWGPAPVVHISAEELAALRASARQQTGQDPKAAEWRREVQRLADGKILLREAQRLRLNETDAVVRSRLLQNMRFAYPQSIATDAELLHTALALGMDERDLVARRRLVQLMEQRLASGIAVSASDVQAHLADHAERYAPQRRLGFQHRFLDTDHHGARIDALALRLQLQLRQGDATAKGDPFLGGSAFAAVSEPEIAKIFGDAFAQAVMAAAPHRWVGPIRSVYGLHFVRVDTVWPERAMDVDALRRRASYAAMEQGEQAGLRAAMAGLRSRYSLQMDTQP